jgi:cephalosporin hydroxylase
MIEIIKNSNPAQGHQELLDLLNVIGKRKVVLEIGVHMGGTFKSWRGCLKPECLIGLENNPKPLEGFKLNDGEHLLICDSLSEESVEKVKNILNGRKIDFLFIDGDHRYESVKKDFENYLPLCSDDAVVAFHDIVVKHIEGCGVYKLWDEIKNDYKNKEIIEDRGKNTTGIGVIWLNSR